MKLKFCGTGISELKFRNHKWSRLEKAQLTRNRVWDKTEPRLFPWPEKMAKPQLLVLSGADSCRKHFAVQQKGKY